MSLLLSATEVPNLSAVLMRPKGTPSGSALVQGWCLHVLCRCAEAQAPIDGSCCQFENWNAGGLTSLVLCAGLCPAGEGEGDITDLPPGAGQPVGPCSLRRLRLLASIRQCDRLGRGQCIQRHAAVHLLLTTSVQSSPTSFGLSAALRCLFSFGCTAFQRAFFPNEALAKQWSL